MTDQDFIVRIRELVELAKKAGIRSPVIEVHKQLSLNGEPRPIYLAVCIDGESDEPDEWWSSPRCIEEETLDRLEQVLRHEIAYREDLAAEGKRYDDATPEEIAQVVASLPEMENQ